MKVLYFKVGSTGLGYDRESGLPDEVLRVCYQLDEVDGDKHTKLDGGEVLYRPEFRTNWPEASMKNGVWRTNWGPVVVEVGMAKEVVLDSS